MVQERQLPLLPAQIAALIQPQTVRLDLKAREKLPALRELAATLKDHPNLSRPEAFFREVLARERSANTGLGHGVAMPHARSELCGDLVIAVGRSAAGIDYGSPDGVPVHLLFLIGAPVQHTAPYHRLIVGLARLIESATNRQCLLAAEDASALIRVLTRLRTG